MIDGCFKSLCPAENNTFEEKSERNSSRCRCVSESGCHRVSFAEHVFLPARHYVREKAEIAFKGATAERKLTEVLEEMICQKQLHFGRLEKALGLE